MVEKVEKVQAVDLVDRMEKVGEVVLSSLVVVVLPMVVVVHRSVLHLQRVLKHKSGMMNMMIPGTMTGIIMISKEITIAGHSTHLEKRRLQMKQFNAFCKIQELILMPVIVD
jgi:hypothetical protein